MLKVLVSPVAFNENVKLKNAIERFLKTETAQFVDYLVVDDASDDGTTQMVESYAARGVKTIRHDSRQGVGAAIRTAIGYALKNGYDVLVIMAGNDKDDPRQIPDLLSALADPEVMLVQGSRYKAQGRVGGDMPFYRRVATRIHPFLLSVFTGKKITDSTNGFRAIRLSLFQDFRIAIHQPWLNAYELEPYILYKALVLGYKVREVAVSKIYPPRSLGYTKMKPIVGWWSILKPLFYLRLGVRR